MAPLQVVPPTTVTNWGYTYSAVEFPLWKVALGAGSPSAKYTVSNGYCYIYA